MFVRQPLDGERVNFRRGMVKIVGVDRCETLRGEAWVQLPGPFEAQQVGRRHAAWEIQSVEIPPDVHHFVFQRCSVRPGHHKRSIHSIEIIDLVTGIEKAVIELSPGSVGINPERDHVSPLPQDETLIVEERHS